MRLNALSLLPFIVLGCRTEPEPVDAVDADGDGYASDVDCNDADAAVHPGAVEICDGIDNDCDGDIDVHGVTDATAYYLDSDGDGYGNPDTLVEACDRPTEHHVTDGSDCNDADPAFYPGATEDDCADPNDYNCDGSVGYADADADGFAACEDCDDADAAVNPDATEVCDGVDNDCDGDIDEASADGATTWYADADGDGYGDPRDRVEACDAPAGYVADDTDCDDTSAAAHPGGVEVCDGLDNDCDGARDVDATDAATFYVDADADGFGSSAVTALACAAPDGFVDNADDCDDAAAGTNPDAAELCDEADNDCDGQIDEGFDGDGDGFVSCVDDCDDTRADVHPGADEVCDGVDNNCNGLVDEEGAVDAPTWYVDYDGDGYGANQLTVVRCEAPSGYVDNADDCDDKDDAVNPGASLACDGSDADCDGVVDNDADGDGASDMACGGTDCDDSDATVAPDAAGVCRPHLNVAVAQGDAGAHTCQAGPGWKPVPYNHTVELTTDGSPVLFVASKRQFKSGGCTRGYLTLEIDGDLVTDASNVGIGSSWQCNAAAALTYVAPLEAGAHTIRLMERTDSSGVSNCTYGTTDTLMALELTSDFNFDFAQGESGANTANFGPGWSLAPYNNSVSIDSNGGPLLLMSTKRQYKSGSCSRGYLTFEVDGELMVDQGDIGVGSSFECNASAVATAIVPAEAGTHDIRLMERTDSGSIANNSMGATDTLLVMEIEPWRNAAYAQGDDGLIVNQYGTNWQPVPYNGRAGLEVEAGGYVLALGSKRQYKAGGCERGYVSLLVDGAVVQDPSNVGIGYSWECNATAPLLYTAPLAPGWRDVRMVERTDVSTRANQTYGTTDSLFLWELTP